MAFDLVTRGLRFALTFLRFGFVIVSVMVVAMVVTMVVFGVWLGLDKGSAKAAAVM